MQSFNRPIKHLIPGCFTKVKNESQFVAAGNSKMNDFGTIPTMLTTALEQDMTKNY
jgi:hypothetical protein